MQKRQRLTEIQVLTKDFTSYSRQINLIKFLESSKVIMYAVKFETFLFDQIFKKYDVF